MGCSHILNLIGVPPGQQSPDDQNETHSGDSGAAADWDDALVFGFWCLF